MNKLTQGLMTSDCLRLWVVLREFSDAVKKSNSQKTFREIEQKLKMTGSDAGNIILDCLGSKRVDTMQERRS